MTAAEPPLPFFVYGTLRPGERYYRSFLQGRTVSERPALLGGALLYDGPGYPYAIAGDGTITGTLIEVALDDYPELLAALDELEEYIGPGHPATSTTAWCARRWWTAGPYGRGPTSPRPAWPAS